MKRGISDTKRYVVDVQVGSLGTVCKIEHKLPEDMATVTGIYLSIAHKSIKHSGNCSLRFAEGSSNSLLVQRIDNSTKHFKKRSYIPLNEPIPQGSMLTGFYQDRSNIDQPYTFKIYIEYVGRDCKTESK